MQETLVDYRETYSFQPVDSFSASRLSDAPTLSRCCRSPSACAPPSRTATCARSTM